MEGEEFRRAQVKCQKITFRLNIVMLVPSLSDRIAVVS